MIGPKEIERALSALGLSGTCESTQGGYLVKVDDRRSCFVKNGERISVDPNLNFLSGDKWAAVIDFSVILQKELDGEGF